MTINCNLNESDYRAMRRYVLFRYRKLHWVFIFILAAALALSWFSEKPDAAMTDKIRGLVAMVVLWSIFMGASLLFMRFSGGRFRGSVGPHIFDVSDDSFIESHADGRKESKIAGIRHVGETRTHFFVLTKTGGVYVVPKRDFQDCAALHSLQAKVAKT